MATINTSDLDADYWATSDDVQDEFQLEIGNQDPDFEKRIKQATRRVRTWYKDADGEDPPDDPPDLLRDATALMAASLAHQAYASNISGDNNDDRRHVFLEDSAKDAFEAWKVEAGIDVSGESTGEASEDITGLSGTIGGDNPIHRGDD